MRRTALGWSLTLLTLTAAAPTWAQEAPATGQVKGTITDATTGETLIGANLLLIGTTTGTTTDLDGRFTLTAPAGRYTLRVSYISYTSKTVTGVVVTPDKPLALSVSLSPEALNLGEVTVEAALVRDNDAALLTVRRHAATVSDGTSAEQISRSGDGDAAEAVKRVTGISVVGGKYVYVRGLAERYSNTQLNGVSIPSPEPEKKVVPFDLFPSGMIDQIVVSKTFMPDQPGTSTAGLIQVETKDFPDHLQLAFSASSGYNSRSQFRTAPSSLGGGTDFLGYDDGTRGLPSGLPTGTDKPTLTSSPAYNAAVAAQFDNQWTASQRTVPLNQGYAFTVGNSTQIGALPLGYAASLTYGSDWSYRPDEIDAFPNPVGSPDQYAYRLSSQKSIYSVTWGGLLNLSTRLGQNTKLSTKTVFNRSADDETRVSTGSDAFYGSDGVAAATRLRYVGRSILSSTLSGDHFLPSLGRLTADWKASYSEARRDEPDNRESLVLFTDAGTQTRVAQRQKRFFANLTDREVNGVLNLSLPISLFGDERAKIKGGAFVSSKTRDFAARRYDYTYGDNLGSTEFTRIEDFTTPDNIAAGLTNFQDLTRGSDAYKAGEDNLAGYLMADVVPVLKWRFIGGFRVEHDAIDLHSATGNVPPYEPLDQQLTRTDFLPSLNLVYSPVESSNIRVGYSRTIARPELRELAPFRFDDYRTSTFGNPFLEITHIQNLDLRWETFPRIGELVAVSVFYKQFDKPIETILLPDPTTTADVRPIGYANSESAYSVGTELELRHSLDLIARLLAPLSVSLNLSLIHSELTQGDSVIVYGGSKQVFPSRALVTHLKRPLNGQSPYVVNTGLTYSRPTSGTDVTLLYNVFGRRLRTVGTDPYDDIYEQPHHQLDLSASQRVLGVLNVKLNIRNLLDDSYDFKLGDAVTNSYRTGRSVSLAIGYSL